MLRRQDGQACRNTAASEMKARVHASRGWARPAGSPSVELAAAGDLGGYQKSGVGRHTQSLFPPRGPRPAESLPPSLGEGPPSLGEGPPSLGSGRRPCSCLTIASLCPPALALLCVLLGLPLASPVALSRPSPVCSLTP